MQIRWFGQSAFLLAGEQTVFIDPFGDPAALAGRGLEFRYPLITGVTADLVLVTHEHFDHNAVDAVGGDPVVLRSTAGRLESPVGEVVAIAAEHDDVAGTARGPNTIFRFTLDGLSVCHFGDFGQPGLRGAQRAAIGAVDVLFVPVGGTATIDGPTAAEVVRALGPRLVVPMHYRTPAINFLEPADAFLDALGARVERLDGADCTAEDLLGTAEEPAVALLAPPL
jgi:L-ascorbate metabolism protein UlaG (beta-lactamase superfamily)